MGAHCGLRAVPVPLDDEWYLDLARSVMAGRAGTGAVDEHPGNPTSAAAGDRTDAQVSWARERGVVIAADECYAEYTGEPAPPGTALLSGTDGVLACHSLSKRSNMAGLRIGFVAGDADLVGYLGATRKHAGLIVPTPVQAAGAASLGDDEHVYEQRDRYEQRRKLMLDGLSAQGLVHDGGPALFYLWLPPGPPTTGGRCEAASEAGTLVAAACTARAPTVRWLATDRRPARPRAAPSSRGA
jgi:aspartate/methionine/tyrosine aminotransferase